MEDAFKAVVGKIDQSSEAEKTAWNELRDEEFESIKKLATIQQAGAVRRSGLNKDPEFMARVIGLHPSLIQDADDSLLLNKEFIKDALSYNFYCFKYLSEKKKSEVIADADLFEGVINKSPRSILEIYELLPGGSPECLISILKKNPEAAIRLINEFTNNYGGYGLATFKKLYGLDIRGIATLPELNTNIDFGLALIKIRESYVRFLSPELLANEDFLLKALIATPFIDGESSAEGGMIFKNQDLLVKAIKKSHQLLDTLDRRHFTPEFIEKVLSVNPWVSATLERRGITVKK